MHLLLSLACLFITCKSFGSAADPVICVPISASEAPANSQGITPINCQFVDTKAMISCYPSNQINFPLPFPARVSCDTEPEFTCIPVEKYLGGIANGQGVAPIRCRLTNDGTTVINCFPPSAVTFPVPANSPPIQCTLMPKVPVICNTVGAIDGAPANANGIFPIVCQTLGDKVNINCYPHVLVKFPQQFPTRVQCLTLYP